MNILENYITDADKYYNKGILVDTGPLLLLVVGLYDQGKIEQFARTRVHTIEHFNILNSLLADFRKVVTTPHILTEVCDLLGKFSSPIKEDVLLKSLAPCMDRMEEKYIESSELGKTPSFRTLGLADSSIVNNAKGKYLVLTEDLPLYDHLKKNKIAAVNFAHLCYP